MLDYLLSRVMKAKGPMNTMSAAVFGLIVALSYSLGLPARATIEIFPLTAPQAYYFVAVIAAFGIIVLKKGQNLLGRKYVNPAATAKLLVLFPFLNSILLAADHFQSAFNGQGLPPLTSAIGYSGTGSFAYWIQSCLGNSAVQSHQPLQMYSTLIYSEVSRVDRRRFKLSCHYSWCGIVRGSVANTSNGE